MVKEIIMERKYGYVMINGKYYEEDVNNGKANFKKISTKKVHKELEMSKEIADKIHDKLDRKSVIIESIMRLDEKSIETLHNIVHNEKRKVNAKTREHHCVDMKIGNFILPIVE